MRSHSNKNFRKICVKNLHTPESGQRETITFRCHPLIWLQFRILRIIQTAREDDQAKSQNYECNNELSNI